MNVVRVRTRETICNPDVSQLLMRGLRECGYPQPAACLADLVQNVASHAFGIFVGFDDGQPVGVTVGQLPNTPWYLAATVLMAYSKPGYGSIVDLVAARLRRWFLNECGVDHVLVLNLFHTDRSYIRGLACFGEGERVGGVIKFRL